MTVIASKIAYAAKATPERPDTDRIADPLVDGLLPIVAKWLAVDSLKLHNVRVTWTSDVTSDLPDYILSAKGETSSDRLALVVSDHFAKLSACRLLGLPETSDAAALEPLTPFIEQNLTELGATVSDLPDLSVRLPDEVVWTNESEETLATLYRDLEVVRIDIECGEVGSPPTQLVFMATPDLLGAHDQPEDDLAGADDEPVLSPRLGPCEVEIKAVADRIRMSVADCSRLEIGQIVSLPGLRFDQLELDIAMTDGPVPLVDAALGADKGRKAVRLNRGLDPAFRLPPMPDPTPSNRKAA